MKALHDDTEITVQDLPNCMQSGDLAKVNTDKNLDNPCVLETFVSKLPTECKKSYIQMKHNPVHTAKLGIILLNECMKAEG